MTTPTTASGNRGRAEQAALVSLLLTLALGGLKLIVWVSTGSLAVLSQAFDSFLDLVGLGVVFLGVRIAAKPADEGHHYGHAKAENLSAFSQTLLIGVIVVFLLYEGVARLLGAERAAVSAPWYALALLGVSALVDVWRARLLLRAARSEGSEALAAGALNVAGDVGTALVATVSLVLVRAGLEQADAAGGLLVAIVVGAGAVRIGKRSADVLMDRAPVPLEAIRQAAATAPGVTEARRVRVRGSGGSVFADITVGAGRTASIERAHDIAEAVERAVAEVAPGVDVVVHVEPADERHGLGERVEAAASRAEGVHEVHNVIVHSLGSGSSNELHVTLHAKADPGLSVEEAHQLSERVEEAVAREMGAEVRVDTHIEPLQGTAYGKVVTHERPDLVALVRRAANEEPEVLDCHEVIVTSVAGGLSIVAHVRGRGGLSLERMHQASERIENAIHACDPEVRSVLLHFEPA